MHAQCISLLPHEPAEPGVGPVSGGVAAAAPHHLPPPPAVVARHRQPPD